MKIQGNKEITIERIAGGVPLVKATDTHDMYFGMGYCHALDRGMQMMMMKILGSGTASEHLKGDDEMLAIDKFFRKMNWRNNMTTVFSKLSKTENNLLQAYCDGANKAFEKNKPWELKKLLGFKDFKWTKEDVVLLARMTGFLTLAQAQGEIERLFVEMVQKGVSRSMLDELFPNILGAYDEKLIRKIKLGDKIIPDAVKWNIASPAFMASNNWVIAGSRTKSGAPIFANDPHLEINRLPAVWYEMAVQVGEKYAFSSTIPGIASLLVARTKDLAWGATYSFMDATDSWVENCKEGKYLKDDNWHEFTIRKETIKRKKGTDLEVTYYENEHGVLDGNPFEEGYYLSSQWSGVNAGFETLKSSFEMWEATTVEQGMKSIGKMELSFSWVLSDTKGNIGFQMSGLMPKRKEGVEGFVPLAGWDSENDWKGFHTLEDLPRSYNPEEGYIITTNNNLNHLGVVKPTNVPMGEYRAIRVKQLLEANDKCTVADIQKMHYDLYSIQANNFMEVIRPLLPDTANGKILKNWDLCYDVKSKGAYLFERIYRSLYSVIFGKALGRDLVSFIQNESAVFIDLYANFDAIILKENSTWFINQTRTELFAEAMGLALDCEAKEWGSINNFVLKNMLLGEQLPKVFGFDKGPFPLPGGRATVHQGQVYTNAGRKTSFAPSYRIISDMSEDCAYTNLAGGVSDRRFSKLYNNDFSNWQKGIYKKLEIK